MFSSRIELDFTRFRLTLSKIISFSSEERSSLLNPEAFILMESSLFTETFNKYVRICCESCEFAELFRCFIIISTRNRQNLKKYHKKVKEIRVVADSFNHDGIRTSLLYGKLRKLTFLQGKSRYSRCFHYNFNVSALIRLQRCKSGDYDIIISGSFDLFQIKKGFIEISP